MDHNVNIRLVCFDLGGVLIRICDEWKEAYQKSGVPRPRRSKRSQVKHQAIRIALDYELGSINTAECTQELGRLLDLSVEQVQAVADAWLRGPYDGVFELIDELSTKNVQTACLSNTNENHWRQMSSSDDSNHLPLDRLSYRFASHLIGHRKPDEPIYRHVEKTTDISPESILFFDDDQTNARSACGIGWHAQQIRLNGDPVSQIRKHLCAYGVIS